MFCFKSETSEKLTFMDLDNQNTRDIWITSQNEGSYEILLRTEEYADNAAAESDVGGHGSYWLVTMQAMEGQDF